MGRFVESTARTNKLYCSGCDAKIEKGDEVIFELNDGGRMKNVYGEQCKCKNMYVSNAIDDSEHPFSSESLGQW